jgi:hypothetical protein
MYKKLLGLTNIDSTECFEGMCCNHLQGKRELASQKTEAAHSFKMLINYLPDNKVSESRQQNNSHQLLLRCSPFIR